MKTISNVFIIAMLVSISNLVMAQSTTDSESSQHEVSIVIDDIFAPELMPIYPVYYDSYVVYYSDYAMMDKYTTKIGLGYKFHFGENALRTKFSFGIANETMDEDYYKVEGENLMLNAFLGYERNITFGKAQVFYGLDFNYTRYSSKSTYNENYNSYESKSANVYSGYGASPLLGVRYYITPNFSLSTEIKYKVESYMGESTYKYEDNPEDKETVKGIYTKFGPLGQLSVNIHF